MEPEGIRKASTRKVRITNQTTSAIRIDFTHSQSQRPVACARPARSGEVFVMTVTLTWWRRGTERSATRRIRQTGKNRPRREASRRGVGTRLQRLQDLRRVALRLHVAEDA